jgi:hypothetical protein
VAIRPRGEGTFLIRVYLGRDPLTQKRLEINETYRGTFGGAQKREAVLKGRRHSGQIVKSSRMTVNQLLDLFLDASRHCQSQCTQFRHKKIYRMYVRPYIGARRIGQLKTGDFQSLFNFFLDPKKAKVEE